MSVMKPSRAPCKLPLARVFEARSWHQVMYSPLVIGHLECEIRLVEELALQWPLPFVLVEVEEPASVDPMSGLEDANHCSVAASGLVALEARTVDVPSHWHVVDCLDVKLIVELDAAIPAREAVHLIETHSPRSSRVRVSFALALSVTTSLRTIV